ncbi:hypothetical protein SAMN05421747_11148 [Parapedobacter composti]|uniref:Uncharacterized protein n=1 Tax=Parapedobacter composti TaxID=623281 RepID=A0A1I1J8G0_9SPHI|nr:hypothetical protein [Parapedobacter composti]SFC44272.1 hypothetical protein SAMN05421747_11148 [Parapedobacter composti]
MDNLFNFRRFGLLAKRHFSQYLKIYGIGALVFGGVIALLFVVVIPSHRSTVPAGHQYAVYFLAVFGGLFVFTSSVFRPYHRPRQAAFNLLLPASTLEKYLLAWLLSCVFYFICAQGVFFAVHYLVMSYYQSRGYAIESMWTYDRLVIGSNGHVFRYVAVTAYFFVHAAALLGAAVFRSYATLKSAFALLIIGLSYGYFNSALVAALLAEGKVQGSQLPFLSSYVQVGDVSYTVSLGISHCWMLAFYLLVAVLLWISAYVKLREKEV